MELDIESTNIGAELLSVKMNGIEKIHQGAKVLNSVGEMYWKRHWPISFPIVGKLKYNTALINKKEYVIPQNGFARDIEFDLLEKSKTVHSYVLNSNDNTKKFFPFKFELYVSYTVNENILTTKYKVINKDKKNMSFEIGAKPAFICDVESENYYIEFENYENNINILRRQRGFTQDRNSIINKNIIKDNKYIYLGKNTFEFGAIILKNITSNKIFLKSKDTNREILTFEYKGFDYITLWTKSNAPFICIEPSFSISEKKEIQTDFLKKSNMIHLKPSEEFECSYSVYF